MPHIKITTDPLSDADKYLAGHRTAIEIDGRPMRDVRSLTLHFNVKDAVTATLELLVRGPLEFSGPVSLEVDAKLLDPKLEVVHERRPDADRWYARELARRLHPVQCDCVECRTGA